MINFKSNLFNFPNLGCTSAIEMNIMAFGLHKISRQQGGLNDNTP